MTKKRQSKTLLNPTLDSITKQKSKPTSKVTKNQNKNSVVAKQNKGKKLPCERKHASKSPAARTATGRVPKGRTLTTRDKHLDKKAKEPEKERPVVVIEANESNELCRGGAYESCRER